MSAAFTQLRVLPLETFIAEMERPTEADLPGVAEIAEKLDVTRQRVVELAETNPDFPSPIARLAVGPVFTRKSVEAFVEQ